MSTKGEDHFWHGFIIFLLIASFLSISNVMVGIISWLLLGAYWLYGKSSKGKANNFNFTPYCESERQAFMADTLITCVENGSTFEEAEIAAEAIGALYDHKKQQASSAKVSH